MVITMQADCRKGQVAKVISAIRGFDLDARIISPGPQVVLGVVEEMDQGLAERICRGVENLAGVEEVTGFDKSWKLAARSFRAQPTVIEIKGRSIGGKEILIMAGPCAVESDESYAATSRAVAIYGAGALRGGAFKPRTSPYSFRGLGKQGLEIMARASKETGLPVITEVLSAKDVDLVASYADILQIGARNMQNFSLLEAVGEIDRPVLLKRGLMASIKELLLSAEYILARGNRQVMLCERGIRTFETETRNTLDLSAVPLLKRYTHLPVVVDPSHAAGKRELVPALARAAVAAGADGLMVEVHPNPDQALSDGRQSLTHMGFRDMMNDLTDVARAVGRSIHLPGPEAGKKRGER